MRNIPINQELHKFLDDYISWFNKKDFKLPTEENHKDGLGMDYYCSKEYLDTVIEQGKDHRGPPEFGITCSLQRNTNVPEDARLKSLEFCSSLSSYLGAKYTAVHVYYPPNGFMSWHCNWDCPGYNILLSHSDGGGFFRYLEDGEIKNTQDPAGWSVKVGYYGSKDETPYWHCAGSTSPRQTIGFVVPDKNMWEMMIEDISTE